MAKSILITGGARSGKSDIAERLVLGFGSAPAYIATAEAQDAEMARRIARHRDRRGPGWQVVEAPLDLSGALKGVGEAPALVDCLTLWLSNLMLDERDWEGPCTDLCDTLATRPGPTVLVTNEVGLGIVPDNALARAFRDAAGLMNQRVAAAVDEVHLCVAGQSLRMKP